MRFIGPPRKEHTSFITSDRSLVTTAPCTPCSLRPRVQDCPIVLVVYKAIHSNQNGEASCETKETENIEQFFYRQFVLESNATFGEDIPGTTTIPEPVRIVRLVAPG